MFQMWPTYNPAGVKLGFDGDGWVVVLGSQDEIAPIVHQYNRNAMLRDAINERWLYQQLGSGAEIRRHCLITQECRHVEEMERRLNQRIQMAFKCRERSCGHLIGKCEARWRERRESLLAASGAVLHREEELLEMHERCRSLGQTISLAATFDVPSWVERLGIEEPGHEDQYQALLGLKDVLERWRLIDVSEQLSSERPSAVPGPRGLAWHLPARLLCLDEECGALTSADERAGVAWQLAAYLLLEGKPAGALLRGIFDTIAGPPDPQYRWLRRLDWLAGRPPPAGTNSSSAAARLRLERLPGD